ncbi:MAG: hypothetical protein A2174_03490 [Candidatus Portnoybacteria bacterium RBG_13_41_18]|uniref:Uncharacterized protein n=1 Tax=Candidatus Portnoybacteria bacterium RBG_13_41_18 TaxID=1801991 RepID=A0A1G2F840_9BACT|nr:MAG: hypothetical protein A2174_03490 [Candidatus Portnoybacteria bacterium RBG_13_41_18]
MTTTSLTPSDFFYLNVPVTSFGSPKPEGRRRYLVTRSPARYGTKEYLYFIYNLQIKIPQSTGKIIFFSKEKN